LNVDLDDDDISSYSAIAVSCPKAFQITIPCGNAARSINSMPVAMDYTSLTCGAGGYSAEERRRFAILNIPRNLFSEASGTAARRSSTSSLKNRMDR